MKFLDKILETVTLIKSNQNILDVKVEGIAIDSRSVGEGFLFMAYKGVTSDGHQFINQAIENGAQVILVDDPKYFDADSKVVFVLLDDVRQASSLIAANYYDHPSKKMKLVGVTGTNGKTTTAKLLFDLFDALGHHCGLISTIENRWGDQRQKASLTTPDAVSLQKLFSQMLKDGVSHVFMEVSSHALHQGRVKALDFDVAVFTNITHDHLDYHGSFAEYIKAKKLLFDSLSKNAYALVNADDVNARVMVQNSKANVKTYALKRPADFKCKIIENSINGLHLEIDKQELYLRLVGQFNAYNATGAYAVSVILGEEPTQVLIALSALNSAEGRMDIIEVPGVNYKAIVDYAHTPDALKKILETLSDVKDSKSEIIVVVGCGGDRDRAKRPVMAQIAYRMSGKCILTSDNPRSEDPTDILDDMLEGLQPDERKNCLSITDRKEAIKMACMLAKDGDIILVAGKGHEKFQEIKGQRIPFDDKEIINAFMH